MCIYTFIIDTGTLQFSFHDAVNFANCYPIFWITTLWFSESIPPLSETVDVTN